MDFFLFGWQMRQIKKKSLTGAKTFLEKFNDKVESSMPKTKSYALLPWTMTN